LSVAEASAAKPNIIFILTDDQGYGDLGRHGHPLLKTPHTDRLYDESVRFDNFYVSPSCSPTRAALLTGMHEFRNGVTHTIGPREHLYREAVLLPQLLKTAGYRTGHIGKWHLGWDSGYHPGDRGFDWTLTGAKHFDPEIVLNNARVQRKGFREDIYFDEAMSFIEKTADQPFFLYLATYSPHAPLVAPEEFIEPFRGHVSEEEATYLGMIANIDYNVGRLLAFLEERALDKKTIVIFMNDNGVTKGLDVYNAGMRGCKCTIWEGGSRAMSFWRWPGKWKPHQVDNLTGHLDVLPTLCELAGAEVSADLQSELEGFSLVPLLEAEEPASWHDDRYLFQHVARWPSGMAKQHKYAMAGARQGNYLLARSRPCDDPECSPAVFGNQCNTLRMVEKGGVAANYTKKNAQFHWGVSPPGRWVLFDTKKDPACRNDLAADHPQRVQQMAAAYDRWWDDIYPVMVARGGEAELNVRKNKKQQAKKARTPVQAETPKDRAEQKSAMFRRMDVNADQQVTREEYVALFMDTFARKDTNGDGKLTVKEFPNPAVITSGDADQDGSLTRQEFQAVYEKQFTRRDRNQDGVVTADEM
jgi:arylsulfatase A-like enzyme